MRDKKKKQPECSQCGRKRGVTKDPCSKPCEEFKANDEELADRVREAFPDWRRKPDGKAPRSNAADGMDGGA